MLSSADLGVGQDAGVAVDIAAVQRSFVQPLRSASASAPARVLTDLSPFEALGVGHEDAVVNCAWSDRLVSEMPRDEPFSFALTFLSRNCSGVPPASRAAGVAQDPGDGISVDVRRAAPTNFKQTLL